MLSALRVLGRSRVRPAVFRRLAIRSLSTIPKGKSPPINTIIHFVPHQDAWVVERLGRFNRVLHSGMHIVLPVIEKVKYCHSLKEIAVPVDNQTAITKDNVTINIDGVLYLRIVDAQRASYGIDDLFFSVVQLAQTTMRSELGKMSLDNTFTNRDELNHNIMEAVNRASEPWGVAALRYEIRDISPPRRILAAMEGQAEAERNKRAKILDSEARRQSEINVAEGQKTALLLNAQAEAEAQVLRANATAKALELVSKVVKQHGDEAIKLRVAEQYLSAFEKLAKRSTTLITPADVSNPANMIAQAMAVYSKMGVKESTTTVDPLSQPPGTLPINADDYSVESAIEADEVVKGN